MIKYDLLLEAVREILDGKNLAYNYREFEDWFSQVFIAYRKKSAEDVAKKYIAFYKNRQVTDRKEPWYGDDQDI